MLTEQFPVLGELNYVTLFVRVMLAMVCGGLIGLERDRSGKAAGFRTHILVCVGMTITMMTGQYMYML